MNSIIKKEKSCGAIVYKIISNDYLYMLEKHNKGHWSFAKGHIEENETEEETALREIKEESNINVQIDNGFREISTYNVKKNIIKEVVFFLAKAKTFETNPQKKEIKEIKWLDKEEILKTLTYDSDKKIFKKALIYINKNLNNF